MLRVLVSYVVFPPSFYFSSVHFLSHSVRLVSVCRELMENEAKGLRMNISSATICSVVESRRFHVIILELLLFEMIFDFKMYYYEFIAFEGNLSVLMEFIVTKNEMKLTHCSVLG